MNEPEIEEVLESERGLGTDWRFNADVYAFKYQDGTSHAAIDKIRAPHFSARCAIHALKTYPEAADMWHMDIDALKLLAECGNLPAMAILSHRLVLT